MCSPIGRVDCRVLKRLLPLAPAKKSEVVRRAALLFHGTPSGCIEQEFAQSSLLQKGFPSLRAFQCRSTCKKPFSAFSAPVDAAICPLPEIYRQFLGLTFVLKRE